LTDLKILDVPACNSLFQIGEKTFQILHVKSKTILNFKNSLDDLK